MPKNKAHDLIQAKMKKNRELKQKLVSRKGPYGLVADFIETMDDIKGGCKTALEFDLELQRECGLLLDRFKQIDPDIELEVKWNRPDLAQEWTDLMVEGVMIRWSLSGYFQEDSD
jgi:hypothetical protein